MEIKSNGTFDAALTDMIGEDFIDMMKAEWPRIRSVIEATCSDGAGFAVQANITLTPSAEKGTMRYNLALACKTKREVDGGNGVVLFDGSSVAIEPDLFDGEQVTDASVDAAESVVYETRRATLTMLMRRMGVSVNVAKLLLEKLEERGCVTAVDGDGKRQVCNEYWADVDGADADGAGAADGSES